MYFCDYDSCLAFMDSITQMVQNLLEPHPKDNGRPLQYKLAFSFNSPRLIPNPTQITET
jgi:hypothetical protein